MTLTFWLVIAVGWVLIAVVVIASVSRINETFDVPDHLADDDSTPPADPTVGHG